MEAHADVSGIEYFVIVKLQEGLPVLLGCSDCSALNAVISSYCTHALCDVAASRNPSHFTEFEEFSLRSSSQGGQEVDDVGASGTTDCFDSSDATCFKVGK
ncbi:hypothetical protein ABBQ32_008794 [Trebouxia sp. C0010 RCD-2024]